MSLGEAGALMTVRRGTSILIQVQVRLRVRLGVRLRLRLRLSLWGGDFRPPPCPTI